VNVGLIGLGLFGGEAAQPREQTWINADSDELLGVAGLRPAHATSASQLFASELSNVRKIDGSIAHRLCALWDSPGAR